MKEDDVQLGQAEETWVKSLVSGDARLLATIVDREFSFIGPDGEVENREAYLAGYEALPEQGVVVESVTLHEVSYRVLGDIGIVTGRALARVAVRDQRLTEDVRFTRVYRRSPQGWLMVAGQGTRIQNALPEGTPV